MLLQNNRLQLKQSAVPLKPHHASTPVKLPVRIHRHGLCMPLCSSNGEASPSTQTEQKPDTNASKPVETEHDYFGSDELMSELRTNFGQRGEVFFFAQAAAMVLIVFCPFQLQGLLDLFATLMLTTGLVFISYALLSLGRNLSPMPQPRQKHSLVTTGMYSYVRHPMYAGLLLTSFGLAAVTRNETRLALAVGLWFILEKKVSIEESFLSQRYPEEYAQYASQVKKFFPFLY